MANFRLFQLCCSSQDASTDNKTEESGGQEGEKESTAEAVDDLDFSFSTKKKKKKKKVCFYFCSAFVSSSLLLSLCSNQLFCRHC